jgi:hypothetical protein
MAFSRVLSLFVVVVASKINYSYGECTNMLFLEESSITTYHKKSSSISLPSLDFKNKLVWNGVGQEIFEPLDFNKYELMVHSSNSYQGALIYRVCEKNTDYKRYGSVMSIPKDGYLIKFNSILQIDSLLHSWHFLNYGTPKEDCREYNREIKKRRDELYVKRNPISTMIGFIVRNMMGVGTLMWFGYVIVGIIS